MHIQNAILSERAAQQAYEEGRYTDLAKHETARDEYVQQAAASASLEELAWHRDYYNGIFNARAEILGPEYSKKDGKVDPQLLQFVLDANHKAVWYNAAFKLKLKTRSEKG